MRLRLRRGRFHDLVERQLALFEADEAELLREARSSDEAWTRAPAAGSEERYGDYQLVVDAIGFNDRWWFDRRGTPHTEQLHVIERYTRLNFGQLRNVATVDDPGAFARPFDVTFMSRLLRPDRRTGVGDLLEFICHEDNQYGQAGQFQPGTGAGNK